MTAEHRIMGLFDSQEQAAAAIDDLKGSGWPVRQVHSPVPSHKIDRALELKKSPVGWFTLVGGILGFAAGFSLAAFTATRWSLIVSGKPVYAWVPFFIVGFEFTILFAVLGNVVGLITQARLPDYRQLRQYDPRCSGRHFAVTAGCPADQRGALTDFFSRRGADVRQWAPEEPLQGPLG